jgi:hypothetical protein
LFPFYFPIAIHAFRVCVRLYFVDFRTEKKGGDKLTLNLTGATASPVTTTTITTPTTPKNKFQPQSPGVKNNFPLLSFTTLPTATIAPTQHTNGEAPKSLQNGAASPAVDNVTVTHFSENRGGLVEKVSVDLKSPKLDNATRAAANQFKTPTTTGNAQNNPFLNSPEPTSPIATTFTATNPFLNGTAASPTPEDVTDRASPAKDTSLTTITFQENNPFHEVGKDGEQQRVKSPITEKRELDKFTADFKKPQTIEEHSVNDDDKPKMLTRKVRKLMFGFAVCLFV